MHFERDRATGERNNRKHGITFDEAVTIFHDPLSATLIDPGYSAGERRLITVRYSSRDRLLVASHVESGETIRIICARPATAAERRRHET